MATVTDLATAIETHVEPGDAIHVRGGYGSSAALLQELVRQYWDVDLAPAERFRLVAIGAGTWVGPLLQAEAVRELVVSFAGLGYPAPGPHPVVQDRIADGTVAFEHWTYLTLIQRLRAGALDHPFVPTNSLAGSSIGPPDATATVESPFGDAASLVLPPLAPDVSLVHGIAADPAGNVVGSPMRTEDAWGSFASDRVLATVETVVDEREVERYSEATTLPSYQVDAVVEAPFGAHPGPLYNPRGVGDVRGYGYDRAFAEDFRAASRDAGTLTEWTREWLLDTDWAGYLERVGEDRLRTLSSQTWPTGSQRGALDRADVAGVDAEPPAETERLVAWTARELADRVEAGGHEVVFGGIGVAHLASWAYSELCDRTERTARPLVVESGVYDFDPPRNDGYIFTPRALPSASLVDGTEFGLGLAMATASSLAVLTGARIDRAGNVNSSRLGGRHFVGSGGANDAMSAADEVVLAVPASPERLVESVEFVTGPGDRVSTVVTQYGTLRKHEGDLRIEAVFVPPGGSKPGRLAAFEEAVGWDVDVAPTVAERGWGPTDDALVEACRAIDPAGDFRR